jgi:hypothetical protein
MKTYMQMIEEAKRSLLDLSKVPHLEERLKVAKALDDFFAMEERISEATRLKREKIRSLEKIISTLEKEVNTIEREIYDSADKNTDYPDIDSPFAMHDDHLGCDLCQISKLPLRHDDETIECGYGDALAVLSD